MLNLSKRREAAAHVAGARFLNASMPETHGPMRLCTIFTV